LTRTKSTLSGPGSDRHAGHAVVVKEDSDELVVGIIFDCEDDGEEIYLGSFESGELARELVALEKKPLPGMEH
jgi:hypothetical protein